VFLPALWGSVASGGGVKNHWDIPLLSTLARRFAEEYPNGFSLDLCRGYSSALPSPTASGRGWPGGPGEGTKLKLLSFGGTSV